MRPRNVACWHSARFALRPLLAVFVPALIAGCAISLVAPYDEIDKQLTELHLRTRVFLAKMSGTRGAYANNIAFYREAHNAAIGVVREAVNKAVGIALL
jgi:hypothetical protein